MTNLFPIMEVPGSAFSSTWICLHIEVNFCSRFQFFFQIWKSHESFHDYISKCGSQSRIHTTKGFPVDPRGPPVSANKAEKQGRWTQEVWKFVNVPRTKSLSTPVIIDADWDLTNYNFRWELLVGSWKQTLLWKSLLWPRWVHQLVTTGCKLFVPLALLGISSIATIFGAFQTDLNFQSSFMLWGFIKIYKQYK